MGALYAAGAIWGVVALVVLMAALAAVPPRTVAEFGVAMKVGLGWPWYLGVAVWGLTVGHDIEADQ